jgi:phosphatidyl-myo-inositol dimannoside synthase
MQALSRDLAREFSKRLQTKVIAWGGSQAFLPWFLLFAFPTALHEVFVKGARHVHLGDALLAPLGVLLRSVAPVKVTATVNGRDIAFAFAPYQYVIPKCLARLDGVICVSHAIARECVRRGVPSRKCVVIPNGVDPRRFQIDANRLDLERVVGRRLDHCRVLISVGRLVKKKGVEWFIADVLPLLSEDVVYVVVGEGPERLRIERAVQRANLSSKVILVGSLANNSRELAIIYNTADVFVMPNISVKGDLEGFGIVAVEAASAGCPVVATRVNGIEDAVIEGETGYLAKAGSAERFAELVQASLAADDSKRAKIQEVVERQFAWEVIGARYVDMFGGLHRQPESAR